MLSFRCRRPVPGSHKKGLPPLSAPVPGLRTPTGATSSGQRLMTTLSPDSAAAVGATAQRWRRDACGLRPTGKLWSAEQRRGQCRESALASVRLARVCRGMCKRDEASARVSKVADRQWQKQQEQT